MVEAHGGGVGWARQLGPADSAPDPGSLAELGPQHWLPRPSGGVPARIQTRSALAIQTRAWAPGRHPSSVTECSVLVSKCSSENCALCVEFKGT